MGESGRASAQLIEAAEARVVSWLATLEPTVSGGPRVGRAAEATPDLLDGVRHDRDAFDFTHRLLEALASQSDPFAAALSLREVSRDLPRTMPVVERLAVRAGGLASLGLPWAVLPVARKWLRGSVAHLVCSTRIALDSETGDLTAAAQAELRTALGVGSAVAVAQADAHAGASRGAPAALLALSGAGVPGDDSAARELQRLEALARVPEVRHLAVDVARLVPGSSAGNWALDHDAQVGGQRLRGLLHTALANDTSVTLEAHDYRSALLSSQLLVRALETPGLEAARIGVTLPAELPKSQRAAEGLILVSRARVAAGGQPLEVTIARLGLEIGEQIHSILSGLPVPTHDTREGQRAAQLRLLATLLVAAPDVRVVLASEEPLLLAAATLLAERSEADLGLQLRAGVAPTLAAAIAEHGFEVRQRLPLVDTEEFDGVIDYLVALAAESADPDAELSHARAMLAHEGQPVTEGAERLTTALADARVLAADSHRVQRRDLEWQESARNTAAFYRPPSETSLYETGGLTAAVLSLTRAHTGAITLEAAGHPLRVPVVSASGFANEAETDAGRFENREWVRGLLARARRSDIGVAGVRVAESAADDPEALIDRALSASDAWGELRASERGARVARLALAASSARDRLLEVLAAESGAPIGVIDADINAAIDAARYSGHLAAGLGAVRGAHFRPDRLALVVADAGVPLAERAESVLAALAAGSAVVLVVHPTVARSSAVLIEEWHAGGLPTDLVVLAVASEAAEHRALAGEFAADPGIERALVVGHRRTAEQMLRRRPELPVQGRFRGLGAVVVGPSADYLGAVRDVVSSLCAGGAADASTARALILLGAAGRSRVLREQLADAVRSLCVGDSARPKKGDPLSFSVGPLPEPPDEAGLRALTELEPGEEWLVQPRQLDTSGRLWRPGVRLGVRRDARFWADAVGMPVIGVIAAATVSEAISLTNELGGGAVAGLHSNDSSELLPWLEGVEAASLVVGKPTTGARVERQPWGAWGVGGMGGASLAGGPTRLLALGSWELREGTASATLHLRGLKPEVQALITNSQPALDYQSFDRVRRAALADALTWRMSLGGARDAAGLGIERNLLRRQAVATHVRLAEGGQLADLVRVVAAGLTVGAPMSVSTGVVLPSELSTALDVQGVSVSLERDDAWLERMAVMGPGDDDGVTSRLRLIGGDRTRTAEWLIGLGEVTLWAEPVTMAGPVELLAFLREQSVSITAHRHGLAMLPPGIAGWLAEQRPGA